MNILKAFEVDVNGRPLDYRVGSPIDMEKARTYFSQSYTVNSLWNAGRHVLGRLAKDGSDYFLKMATTEGIGVLTRNEYVWNDVFHAQYPRSTSGFWVPHNVEEGTCGNQYYFVTDVLQGTLLATGPEPGTIVPDIKNYFNAIISLTDAIGSMPGDTQVSHDHRQIFLEKVMAWYEAIPRQVRDEHELREALAIVERGVADLSRKPRHGDLAPWHLMSLPHGKLGVLDGEHYTVHGVENYDIGYFIQRLFAVLNETEAATTLYDMVLARGIDSGKFRTVLAARAIGGYLDASLADEPQYESHRAFREFVISAR